MALQIAGEHRIAAPRERVWACLTDPAFLKEAIPGCDSVAIEPDGAYLMRIGVKAGPIGANVKGRVRIDDPDPPRRYTLRVSGSAGLLGSVAGHADVALVEEDGTTRLAYAGAVEVKGWVASLGAAMIESTTQKLTEKFFARLRKLIERGGADTPTLAAVDE